MGESRFIENGSDTGINCVAHCQFGMHNVTTCTKSIESVNVFRQNDKFMCGNLFNCNYWHLLMLDCI
jgi:hypothetical protein